MTLPSTISDATNALVGGLLGTIQQVKIGDILVSACTGLSNPREVTITEKPLAAGYPITDAIVPVPQEITLDIIFANPQYSAEAIASALLTGNASSLTESWRDKRDKLYAYQDNKEIIEAQTHENNYTDMVVKLIDPVFDPENNWDGFFATVVLHQITQQTSTGGSGVIDSVLEAVGDLSE
jgi:hypothetical protein